jgi:hypothetical protein
MDKKKELNIKATKEDEFAIRLEKLRQEKRDGIICRSGISKDISYGSSFDFNLSVSYYRRMYS